ncbi:MAG: hypothetical protein ACYDA4_15825, partial [Ignavibacteriaceae bacterium]
VGMNLGIIGTFFFTIMILGTAFVIIIINNHSVNYSKSNIELFDLVKIFVPIAKYGDSWMTGADNDNPIDWKTDGISMVDEKDHNYDLGPFMRTGNVVITINKQTINILKRKIEALPWDITLYGSHSGIDAILISNNLLSSDNIFDPKLLEKYFKGKGCNIILIKCDNKDEFMGSSRLYKLGIKNRSDVYLLLEYGFGNAGYSGRIIILLSKPDDAFCLNRKLIINN